MYVWVYLINIRLFIFLKLIHTLYSVMELIPNSKKRTFSKLYYICVYI